MPNRIIREGILSSERVDLLDDAAEVFYRRLISVVDDFGRFDGRPRMLRVTCYPLRVDRVREADISRWLHKLETAGLIALYEHDAKPYLELLDFRQQVRAKDSKWPARALRTHSGCAADATHKKAPAPEDEDVVEVGDVDGGDKPLARSAPVGVRPDVWASWLRYKGKKATTEALRLQAKHLEEWAAEGHDPNAIIEASICNTWAGLFKPKAEPLNGRKQTLAERRADNMDRLTGKARNERVIERTIEGTAERVGREVVPALPSDLREPCEPDVGRH